MTENLFFLADDAFSPADLSYSRNISRGMCAYHWHHRYELAILLSGSGWCYRGTDIYQMKADHIYIIPPNTEHMMTYSSQTLHSMYHVYFQPDLVDDLQRFGIRLKPALDVRTELKLNDELRTRLDHALSQTSRRSESSSIDLAICQLLVECILLSMARQMGLENDAQAHAVSHPAIQSLVQYIAQNFADDLTLDQLSSHVGLNKSYLCRLFRSETGLTPVEYLNSVRIQNACRLLRETDLNISRISLLSGFNSAAYFDRQFRAQLGISPTAYLKEYRPKGTLI